MTGVDLLVTDYLARLDAAAAVLPSDRRAELLSEIGEHIADARAAGAAADEAAVRTLLDRLGPPAEIVAAAQEDVPTGWSNATRYDAAGFAVPPPVALPRGTGLELAAVLMLTAGSLIPVVGWLAGVVLLWCSSLWRVREKLLGTLVVPLGPGAVLFAALLPFGSEHCVSESAGSEPALGLPPPPGVPPVPPPAPDQGSLVVESSTVCTTTGLPVWAAALVAAVVLVAPIVVAVVLFRIAQRRAAAAPPRLVSPRDPAAVSPWSGLEIAAVVVLGVGGLLFPVIPLLVGLLLVCLSPQWTPAVKAVTAVLVLLPGAGMAAFYLLADSLGIGALGAYALTPIAGLLAAALLVVQLQRRG